MARIRRNSDRFARWYGVGDFLTAEVNTVHSTSPPTSMNHEEAHVQVISGWTGGTYVLPLPINAQDGDCGQIMLQGHATQTVSFANYNGGDPPSLPTDPTKMIVMTWRRVNGSYVANFTGERDWVY